MAYLLPISSLVHGKLWDFLEGEGILVRNPVEFLAVHADGCLSILQYHQSSEHSIENKYHNHHRCFENLESEYSQGSLPLQQWSVIMIRSNVVKTIARQCMQLAVTVTYLIDDYFYSNVNIK